MMAMIDGSPDSLARHDDGPHMPETILISVLCPDRIGLVSAITGRLYNLGTNLGDTTFAVLGGGAEFTAVCELTEAVSLDLVEMELKSLPELEGADVSVTRFDLPAVHGPSGHVTHSIEPTRGDRPGLIARLCEVFVQFGANVVRLNSEKVADAGAPTYVIRIAVWIPENRAASCLATVTNTAGELRMTCRWREA